MDDWLSQRPAPTRFHPLHFILGLVRFLALVLLIYGGVALMVLLRLLELPLFGARRPWTPLITQFVCLGALQIFGLRLHLYGQPYFGRRFQPVTSVSNHISWMDIFVLNAAARSYFVAKSEVAGWPGIGLLARVTGTLFINRKKQHAKAQQAFFKKRLSLGHHLTFFPEGTSSDGVRILPFKSTLFEALLTDNIKNAAIQPISLRYQPAQGYDARLYGWWGNMGFTGHFWRILTTPQHGDVYVTYHAPLMARDFPNRKALAQACHAKVLAGFTAVPMS